MKILKPFTIADCRLPIARKSRGAQFKTRRCQDGIALVITLIMLAVTLVMAVAFMALARREKGSVTTSTDTKVAQLATEAGVANAVAQINASMLAGFTPYVNGGITNTTSSNAYNLHLIVSTNYINAYGFTKNSGNPTNVNYFYPGGGILGPVDFVQNVANLWYLPRAPVMISSNEPVGRFYLDLNENGRFDPNGWQTVISGDPANPYYHANGQPAATFNPPDVLSNFFVGDPEWVGVLEHPDAPHGPNNHFTSRYAFIAVPAGNTMDMNYIHNQARNTSLSVNDGFTRNQGVGSWEINLAAFFADLNTNIWSPLPLPNNTYYAYNQPNNNNSGYAFQDAYALLRYRYNNFSLPSAKNVFFNAGITFPSDGIDDYSQGPLQTTLDTNEDAPTVTVNTTAPWSGADNTNHFFTLSDFFDSSKLGSGLNSFINRLNSAGTTSIAGGLQPSYDRYTFYRMLNELGTDSSPDDGKLNLNYCNINTNIVARAGPRFGVVTNLISVVSGAETNLEKWRPWDFFLAASDQMLRTYTSNWWSANYVAFSNTFRVTVPFGITNIPVWVSNQWVYTPAVNRLLQLAANICDATTNGNYNLPHVFRPVLERVNNNGDIFIVGYVPVTSVSGPGDVQLQPPYDISQLSRVPMNTPIVNRGVPVNVFGVPWIIGAKKGLPAFNQLAMVNSAQISRRLQISRPTTGVPVNQTNQMYVFSITNYLSLSFWNSYTSNYYSRTGQGLTIYASDVLWLNFTNNVYNNQNWLRSVNLTFNRTIPSSSYWPGSRWASPQGVPADGSFFRTNWMINFFPEYIYRESTGAVVPYSVAQPWDTTDPLWPLDHQGHLGLMTTNLLQAFILDGNNVIDYVQFRDPQGGTNLDSALRDPGTGDPGYNSSKHYYWETNGYDNLAIPSWGIAHQIVDSESYNPNLPPSNNGQYGTYDQAAATTFRNFMQDHSQDTVLTRQAPYTPERTVFCPYLMQANDPLVHTLASDLSYAAGTSAQWQNNPYAEGAWLQSDDPTYQPAPQTPATPVGGRYQPWSRKGSTTGLDGNVYNLAYKDPLVWGSDYWDFPTNLYPTVGWLGRVHRGTPWQTIFLKSTNIWSAANGPFIWINWTGGIQTNYFDAANSLPWQDWALFDIFTTRFNDNAVRGTLPVNVGAGMSDGGLAAWSALFSGMVGLTNNEPFSWMPMSYTSLIIDPAGVDTRNSPLWNIVNGTNGINATRGNTNLFPYQSFTHVGQILATPALSVQSPFLNTKFLTNGVSDEMYEWLPQQMMGLVRGTEPRYVLYCFGQTLRPAPGGTVLSGPYFQLVTNYQVVAESAVRAVIRVDNANTAQPHAVVESYNVLPPN